MRGLMAFCQTQREKLLYLFFGGLTTLVNLAVFAFLPRVTTLSMTAVNALANLAAILFAYVTNRIWVFQSKKSGWAAAREFGAFFACRLATFVLDMILVLLGLYVAGPLLFSDSPSAGLVRQGIRVMLTGASDREILAGQPLLWRYGVKLVSNFVVIVSNYVLSKRKVFTKD